MGIRAELTSTIQDCVRDGNNETTRLYVTPEDEQRLASMSRDEAGGDVTGNLREDWKRIGGLEGVWDAEQRHCE